MRKRRTIRRTLLYGKTAKVLGEDAHEIRLLRAGGGLGGFGLYYARRFGGYGAKHVAE
jgi:hypothetical protein